MYSNLIYNVKSNYKYKTKSLQFTLFICSKIDNTNN